MIDIDNQEVESFVFDDFDRHVGSSYTELHRQLKEQDLSQLHQEHQLTELEMRQLEDRRILTLQGVKQVEQYLALKEQEVSK